MGTNSIACIGAGHRGKNLIRNFNELGGLSWVCELEADCRRQLAGGYTTVRFTGAVDQVLADPETVVQQ